MSSFLQHADSLERFLPTLVTAICVVAGLGFVVWLLNRWVHHLTGTHPGARPPATEAGARKLNRSLWHTAEAFALVAAVMVVLRGNGKWMPQLTWRQMNEWVMDRGLRILFILFVAFVLIRITDFLVTHLQATLLAAEATPRDLVERRKRIDTIGKLFRLISTIAIMGVALLMALRQVDLDITPILTGAGVLGVAVGFGAQTLVKDIIAGLFLILENQIRVGDVVTINGKTGQVEDIRLRIMILRAQDGALYVFQNGNITEYSNLTKDYSYAVLELSLPYKENLDRVIAILKEVGTELQHDSEFGPKILAPLEVLGVDSLAGAAVVIKTRMKTVPIEQWNVDRELRLRIKMRFDKENITLA